MTGLWHTIHDMFVENFFSSLKDVLVISAIFVASISLYFAVAAFRKGKLSVRGVLAEAFPKSLYSGPSFRVDFWNFILLVVVVGPIEATIFALVGLAIGVGFNDMLSQWFGPHPAMHEALWVIVSVQFAGGFLGREFAEWATHYAQHHVPFLWSLHRSHHSTETLTLFASARAHPLDTLLLRGAIALGFAVGTGLALYMTGVGLLTETTTLAVVVASFLNVSSQALSHSHARLSYGKFNAIIGGPIMHQLHHSAEQHHHDKNFSTDFMFFDWLFGTLYIPEKGETWRTGLSADELGENNPHATLQGLYLEPLRRQYGQIRSLFRPRVSRISEIRSAH